MINILFRFGSKIQVDNKTNCWNWIGSKINEGYGQFWFNKKPFLAHRVAYILFKGKIPEGLQIDHICRNRKCVNPEHLELVTPQENTKRGNTGLWQKLKTHCPQGHPYNKENTYITKRNQRDCKKCNLIYTKAYKQNTYMSNSL